MDVAVDAAGQHEKPRGVDFGSGARQLSAERDDAAVFHTDVAFADVGGGDDRPAANDQIKFHSAQIPLSVHVDFATAGTQEPCNLRQWTKRVAK